MIIQILIKSILTVLEAKVKGKLAPAPWQKEGKATLSRVTFVMGIQPVGDMYRDCQVGPDGPRTFAVS